MDEVLSELDRVRAIVIVVASDVTASAAESFLMAMRAFPHVKLAGARSRGILSDVLQWPLPNGWYLGLSAEVYRDADGVCYEARGIPVDLQVLVFEGDDLETTYVEALEEIVQAARDQR